MATYNNNTPIDDLDEALENLCERERLKKQHMLSLKGRALKPILRPEFSRRTKTAKEMDDEDAERLRKQKEKSKRYYTAHRERLIAISKKYYLVNREEINRKRGMERKRQNVSA